MSFSVSIISFFGNPSKGCVVIFLFSFFLFSFAYSNPTTCDTVPLKTKVKWSYFHQLTSFAQEGAYIDIENINGFQHYEFPRKVSFFIASKGNIGHSTRQLEFLPRSSRGFTLYGSEPFFGNSFFKEELRFYEPEHVYTNLFYVSGPRREQTFNVLHNQRLSESLILGLSYRVLNSPGRYSRTASANTNWYATFNYSNHDRPYGAIGGLIINRIQNQESGGLRDRLAFEANNWNDGGFLSNAELRDWGTTIFLHQFLRARSRVNEILTDTLDIFSDAFAANDKANHFHGRLFHEFSLANRSINFFDRSAPELSFFGFQPINSIKTHDSTTVFIMENSLGLIASLPLGQLTSLSLKGFASHRFARITQNVLLPNPGSSVDSERDYEFVRNSFNQIIVGGEAGVGLSSNSSFRAEGHFVALGKNFGDFGLTSTLSLKHPNRTPSLQLNAGLFFQEAPYFLSQFLGNYVSWSNDFEKQRILNLGIGFNNDLVHLRLNGYLLRDMVFMGPEALPVQNSENFGLVSLRGGFRTAIGPFNTNHEILLQYVGSENFERFPLLTSYHSFFFEFSLFRKAMFLNLGVDFYYNTPYKPMGFMPVVRQFFAQDTFKSDHILTADFFATFRIDRARIFLKFHNIGSEIPQIPVVYHVPFYPMQDFAIKFGVTWPFFN